MQQTFSYYMMAFRKDFVAYCNEELQDMNLSLGLLYFILFIGKHPSTTPKTLCEVLKMDSGHATRSLLKLEQAQFITQTICSKDKRSRILNLSAKGQEAFERCHHLFKAYDDCILKSLSLDEQKTLFTLLEKMHI